MKTEINKKSIKKLNKDQREAVLHEERVMYKYVGICSMCGLNYGTDCIAGKLCGACDGDIKRRGRKA